MRKAQTLPLELAQDQRVLEHALHRLDQIRLKRGRHLLRRVACRKEVSHRFVPLVAHDLQQQSWPPCETSAHLLRLRVVGAELAVDLELLKRVDEQPRHLGE